MMKKIEVALMAQPKKHETKGEVLVTKRLSDLKWWFAVEYYRINAIFIAIEAVPYGYDSQKYVMDEPKMKRSVHLKTLRHIVS